MYLPQGRTHEVSVGKGERDDEEEEDGMEGQKERGMWRKLK